MKKTMIMVIIFSLLFLVGCTVQVEDSDFKCKSVVSEQCERLLLYHLMMKENSTSTIMYQGSPITINRTVD